MRLRVCYYRACYPLPPHSQTSAVTGLTTLYQGGLTVAAGGLTVGTTLQVSAGGMIVAGNSYLTGSLSVINTVPTTNVLDVYASSTLFTSNVLFAFANKASANVISLQSSGTPVFTVRPRFE